MRVVPILLVLLVPSAAFAESWCAYPLWVHEWGVQAFDGNGAPASPVGLPRWFHRSPGSASLGAAGTAPATRHLPPDGGMRALPVLHFYSGGTLSSNGIPVGIEVGFTHGEAIVWYPQVDQQRPAAQTNSTAATRSRASLVRQRRAMDIQRGGAARRPLPSDPTRQLIWDRLLLTPQPAQSAHASNTPWVDALREFDALWVNRGNESERFVFYEARTRERVQITLSRGNQYRSGRRHIVMRNTGRHAVHDVFFTHREGQNVYVFFAPSIPAGRSAGFVIEDHRVSAAQLRNRTRGHLRGRLVDGDQPSPPSNYRWNMADCVMMRDPAVPVEEAEGHRLYEHEVDAIVDVWGPTFFDRPGTTITYREDTDYLDAAMPLSVYTDMYNFVKLRRAGLAVWKDVRLP